MSITLNHTIVPAKDKEAAATFFANLFGLRYDGPSPSPLTIARTYGPGCPAV